MSQSLFKFKTYRLQDWLSAYRLLAVPLLLYTLLSRQQTPFLVLLSLSLATDVLDGLLARRLKQENRRGAQLDSYGDLLTVPFMLASLFIFKPAFLEEQAVLLSVLVGLYFLELASSILRYGKPSSFHTYLDKTSFILLGIFYFSLFLFGFIDWLFYAAMAVAILGELEELVLVLLLPRWQNNVKGLYWLLQEKQLK
ncbi:CDP-diacylglycerol--glycerol-3-phosphate 3-phosphatidyltransferase [Pontibacter mucosus]|uniref:CDP-diacylglycerol--glycerol-3-phosphate 3-phosphatidyltransferase n=1 Tax=Pontibacter mucosus TaxID=1649266 RepID=A0A2T5YTC7_9BACT|nr:CDP-alcohol phosphatidyltransferase family protein [Pontibacter mucosus]PTX22563.1 CDP-diacylglycerol--glycerol-3-phosphate 3-phosphatidyltransferase [Pontibacter mucosus]